MNITHTDYIELSAPLETALVALRDPERWAHRPGDAECTGEMWRWGSELYTLTCTVDQPGSVDGVMPPGAHTPQQGAPAAHSLRWQAVPVAVYGIHVQIDIQLYDAVIATHALVRVSLLNRGQSWPWQRARARWRLAQAVGAAGVALQQAVHQSQAVSVAVPQAQLVAAAGSASTTGTLPAPAPAEDTVAGNGSRAALLERLRSHYPQTVAAFEAMGAPEHLERVWWLERNWERILRGEYNSTVYEQRPAVAAPPRLDYDLIYAGGGLGLIHAAVMAHCYGRRVLLFDRSEVGCVHREWNISRSELQVLVTIGLVTWDELTPVIMREYRAGVVDFYTGPYCKVPHSNLWFAEVLNVAIDAGGLLRLMRRKFEQAGGTILDRRAFRCVRALGGPTGAGRARSAPAVEVVLETMDSRQEERYTARLLLDGMGSTSPLALLRHAGQPFAGVCPTVGTVVSGLVPGTARTEFDPTIGDILISVDDTQDGKQMIWEGFPGRGDELTVYVFYYAALKRAGSRMLDPRRTRSPGGSAHPPGEPRYSLLALFEQYFAMLPSYKKPGPDFAHIKPVYGYIPGRHSLQAQEAPLLRGVLSVGDAAAQQSPLTYCGFGSHVRNLHRTTSLLEYALQHDVLEPEHLRHITAFQTNVSLNWVFSRFMQAWGRPHNVNQLQNAFLGALNELGGDLAARFFRDRMRWHDYNQVVWYTMLRYPDVFLIAWPVLGVSGVWQWFRDYLRFSASAAYASVGQRLGTRGERWLQTLAERIDPALGLQVRARYAEWRAMGWL